ncbi:MAG: efflux RND transporter permease subunit [Bacteroidales bacterium]|nr:efflux RND transporter permease subunit [Bacteroidales bacterium]MBN2820818.1 efflux RND transporter permease subunit [Bacteroidales bacterium]
MSAKQLSEQVIRDFKLTSLALKNKNTVYLLTLILLFFGVYSYRNLPKELFPEIVWPQIMVQTVYPGNSPEDIENLVTRPIEKEVENVRGLKELTSISAQDASMIFVEFNTDVDIEDALRRVKDAVDNSSKDLPTGSDFNDPLVFDIDFSEFAILNINLSGDYSVEELKYYAEYLQDELENIKEVSKVLIEGVNEREIKVNVDLMKLEAYEISFYDITNAISAENISMSSGEILLGQTRRSVSIVGEFEKIDQLKNIIIKKDGDKIVYLKDVADVIDGYTEPTSYARLDKNPVVSVQIVKKGGENLLSTTDKIYDVLDLAKEQKMLPESVQVSITNDQSELVDMQLNNLENSMIMGIIFVVLILFFFLGTRNALFVGLAIPMSMFISFVVIGVIDFRINMIVLFSLILALGMLVDNAIVVVENIYRFVDMGYEPWEAAKKATGEIAGPIIASTATTLAAFFPLAMWEGIMGEFMKYLPITLIIVLTSSLFVALVIIPVVSATFIKVKTENGNGDSARKRKMSILIASGMLVTGAFLLIPGWRMFPNLLILFGIIGLLHQLFLRRMESWFQAIFLVKLERFYSRALKYALRGKNLLIFFGSTMVLLVITIMLFFGSMPDVKLFPTADPNYVNIVCELPVGTDITRTNDFMQELEDDITEFVKPYKTEEGDPIVESVLSTVGKGDPMDFSAGVKPNQSIVTITFIDYDLRDGIKTSEIMRNLSDKLLGNYPGVEFEISQDDMGPPTGKPINLEIIGRDFDELVLLTDRIKEYLESANIDGIEGLKMNISTQKPELIIHIDRDKAQRFGLSTQFISWTLRQALFGNDISDFKVGEDEYPIVVRLKDEYRYDLSVLSNIKIPVFGDGPPAYVPLSSVATIEYSTTFSSVRRKDMDRVITLYSNVVAGYNANTIIEQMRSELESFEMPAGYAYEFTGEQQEADESMAFLKNAMLIALALIMLILVTQFNSIIRTLIIMGSVLFSTIGVFGGLWTFKMDFIIIMTGVGIISLAGIVVNNAIVLIDYIELLKARKRKELGLAEDTFLPIDIATECIIEAGKTRLRPVLLTAITTVLGLLPMAVGLNFDFVGLFKNYDPNIYFGGDMSAMWSPMSWTVIFGLTFSTFLTLIIVPVMYRMTTIATKKWIRFTDIFKDRHKQFVGDTE